MTIAVFAMNGLLAVLLLAALAFGWRLERRLKALRDSHDGFAKAVADLDAAAMRAEQGLADLRAATDEAAETLAERIETARGLTASFETPAARAPQDDGLRARHGEERRELVERRVSNHAQKSRAKVDDDLFEADGPPLRSIPGGRR